jgi:hypothetical protein
MLKHFLHSPVLFVAICIWVNAPVLNDVEPPGFNCIGNAKPSTAAHNVIEPLFVTCVPNPPGANDTLYDNGHDGVGVEVLVGVAVLVGVLVGVDVGIGVVEPQTSC